MYVHANCLYIHIMNYKMLTRFNGIIKSCFLIILLVHTTNNNKHKKTDPTNKAG